METGLEARPAVGTTAPATADGAVAVQRTGTRVPWPRRRATPRKPWLRTGWPLTLLYVAFPIWWVLGLSEFIFLAVAVPMGVYLFKHRPIKLPRGSAFWLLFLLWVAVGIVVLTVPAPGAQPDGGSLGRYFTFSYRLSLYLAATTALLFIGNTREKDLPTQRISRLLGYMFVFTAVGGLVGTFAAGIEFSSAIEYALPGALRANPFVASLVHPRTSEIQMVLGYAEARPVAPFSYANTWGANYSFFLPFFLISWLGPGAGWRRYVAPVVLIGSAIPVVYSLNRGLWGALTLGLVYVAFRLAAMGKLIALQALVIGFVLAAVLFVFSPLGTLVNDRLAHPHSNDRRSQLSSLTFHSVATGSPVIGFGTTRKVQGSFASIAGGTTAHCPGCGVPPLGTQGTLWSVFFFQGLVGTGLFLAFFLFQFFRHWRDRWPFALAGCAILLMAALELFVYDFNGAAWFTIMIAIGLMWRRDEERLAGDAA